LYRRLIAPETRIADSRFIFTNSIENVHLSIDYTVNSLLAQFLRDPQEYPPERLTDIVTKIRLGEIPAVVLREALTAEGQRKCLSLWVGGDARIYSIEASDRLPPEEDYPYPVRIIGVDFGFHHPRIAVVGCENTERGWVYTVVDYWHGKASTGSELIQNTLRLSEKWRVRDIYVPHDQPGIKSDLIAATKTPIRKAWTSVGGGITVLQGLLNRGCLRFVDCGTDSSDLALAELQGYSWQLDKNGLPKTDPVKCDDHFPDAIRYAVASHARIYNKRHSRLPTDDDPDDPGDLNLNYPLG
jgi:hypothetical protein